MLMWLRGAAASPTPPPPPLPHPPIPWSALHGGCVFGGLLEEVKQHEARFLGRAGERTRLLGLDGGVRVAVKSDHSGFLL